MTKRKIIRTSVPKNNEKIIAKAEKYAKALTNAEALHQQLTTMNEQLKSNSNAMVSEIEKCLQNLFARVERLELHVGLVRPPQEPIDVQTISALAEETAMATDTMEMLSTNAQPSAEAQLAE